MDQKPQILRIAAGVFIGVLAAVMVVWLVLYVIDRTRSEPVPDPSLERQMALDAQAPSNGTAP